MSKRKAAVLSMHPLFGEGIARLLESEVWLQVEQVDAHLTDAPGRIRTLNPDVVIVEADAGWLEVLPLFQAAPDAVVICVTLANSSVDIYRNWRVLSATPEDLRHAVRRCLVRRNSAVKGAKADVEIHRTH